MTHKRHEDGLHHGGFSAEVWNQEELQNYCGGFGAIYNSLRTPERDQHLEMNLRASGLSNEEIASFLIHRAGRHAMDCYSFGPERLERDTKSLIRMWRN